MKGKAKGTTVYGLSDAERRRIALLHSDRTLGEVGWLTVSQLAEALDCSREDALSVIQAYAHHGSPVETIAPDDFATDIGVTTRTLRNWERRGLPSIGEGATKRYVAPVCFDWTERFQKESFSAGRGGFRRHSLSALDVAREVFARHEATA